MVRIALTVRGGGRQQAITPGSVGSLLRCPDNCKRCSGGRLARCRTRSRRDHAAQNRCDSGGPPGTRHTGVEDLSPIMGKLFASGPKRCTMLNLRQSAGAVVLVSLAAVTRMGHAETPTEENFRACNAEAEVAVKSGMASPTTKDHQRAEAARKA